MLSEREEAEMDRARSATFMVPDHSDDEEEHTYHERRRDEHEEERGEGMMDSQRDGGSSGFDSHTGLLPDRMDRMDRISDGREKEYYNFAPMEEFAKKEREDLGQSPNQWVPGANGAAEDMRRPSVAASGEGGEHITPQGTSFGTEFDRTQTTSAYGDASEHDHDHDHDHDHEHEHANGDRLPRSPSHKEGEIGGSSFHRRRQRKLSNSNPVMRRQGKLALFEGIGSLSTNAEGETETTPARFKAPRQPKNLGNGQSGGFVPFSDSAPGHDRPYRFSFYSNALPVTIHARSLAELPAEGQSFQDLFTGKNNQGIPESRGTGATASGTATPVPKPDIDVTPNAKVSLLAKSANAASTQGLGQKANVPGGAPTGGMGDDGAEVPTWWLDVLSPTDEEMRLLSKVFGIHPLTTEDILLEETREKIELFRNYYLVCFRSFDQDPYSQTYLEPLNMYIIVFREGTLSFHFRGTPHPQNVRRRIKHLKDYISVTSDWISYALIDDITDAFGPLIQSIEYEVDSIDELVLILKDSEQSDMLRR